MGKYFEIISFFDRSLRLDAHTPTQSQQLSGADKFMPILSIECKFEITPPEMRLCIGLIHYSQKQRPLVFALRFETPHPKSGHNSYHGQFTRTFEIDGNTVCGLPTWLPEYTPCLLFLQKILFSFLRTLICFHGIRAVCHISDLKIDGKYLEILKWMNNECLHNLGFSND